MAKKKNPAKTKKPTIRIDQRIKLIRNCRRRIKLIEKNRRFWTPQKGQLISYLDDWIMKLKEDNPNIDEIQKQYRAMKRKIGRIIINKIVHS